MTYKIIPTEKICSQCKTLKPLSAFYKQAGTALGVKSACRECSQQLHASQNPSPQCISLPNEEWREVPDYEGYYSVSNIGRVRRDKRGAGSRDNFLLKPHLNNTYHSVRLSKLGIGTIVGVHRLVALAFLPSRLPEQLHVNHKDGNPINNHVANLEWCTPLENARHAKEVLNRYHRGESNATSKLTTSDVVYIRQHPELRGVDLAKQFNVSKSTIDAVRQRRNWKHLP